MKISKILLTFINRYGDLDIPVDNVEVIHDYLFNLIVNHRLKNN